MAKIAVIETETQQGGTRSVLGLARKLKQRGHRVAVVRIPDGEERARNEGFEFLPLFADVWPRGLLRAEEEEQARTGRWDWKKTAARLQQRYDRLLQGAMKEALAPFAPDLCVVDSGAPLLALGAHGAGVPVVQFATMFLSSKQPGMPPVTSGLIPDGGAGFAVKNALAWRKVRIGQWLKRRIFWNEPRAQRQLATVVGFPVERIDFAAEFSPLLKLPTMVFCPRAFELPRPDWDGVAYVEASIDLERREAALDWSQVDPAKPLIFSALGSMAVQIARDRTRKVLQGVLDAVAQRPAWQGLVAIGKDFAATDFRIPANAVVVGEAPQLAVLKRAAVMVNHGGFNSVKECIHFGVPQVSLPMFFDHPGDVARLVHHGLGVRGTPETPVPELVALIDRALSDPRIRERTRAMSAVFQAAEAKAESVAFVERALPAGRAAEAVGA